MTDVDYAPDGAQTDGAQSGGAQPEGAKEDHASLVALRAESAALKEQALRYAAEAENTRRRAERDVNDARAYAINKFARDLLGVADNLARALEHAPRDSADAPTRNLTVGLEMTQKELMTAFERNGLKRIDPAAGDRFDPHQHQAVMEQPSEEWGSGSVLQVLQVGYDLFGRIVRPAMVVVAAKGSTGREPQPGGGQGDVLSPPLDDAP